MSATLLELGHTVAARRLDMGLTQARLAKLCGLSRATVNQVENANLKDLSLSRAARLLDVLGLSIRIAPPRSPPAGKASERSSALDLAARTASVSYRSAIGPHPLRRALLSGTVDASLLPHLHALLDEAPVSLLAAVVEQLHVENAAPRAQSWAHLRTLARQTKSSRALWQ